MLVYIKQRECGICLGLSFRESRSARAFFFLAAAWLLISAHDCYAQKTLVWESAATGFNHHYLAHPELLPDIKSTGNLAAEGVRTRHRVQGSFEYEFTIVEAGWYELLIESSGRESGKIGQKHEYIIDKNLYLNADMDRGWKQYEDFKAGNVWLTAGKHTLRVQNYSWQGFHPITRLKLQQAGPGVESRVRVAIDDTRFFAGPFLRRSDPLVLDVYTDGQYRGILTAQVYKRSDNRPVGRRVQLDIPKTLVAEHHHFRIKQLEEGAYYLGFFNNKRKIQDRDIRRINFDVIDTATTSPIFSPETGKGKLLGSIDCAKTRPDYTGGVDELQISDRLLDGRQRLLNGPSGDYRETGEIGLQQHRNGEQPSWMAYTFPEVRAQQAYLVEVDYPDDALRSFVIGIRDSDPLYYTISSGVDGGGEFELSQEMQTHRILYWPRGTTQPKVVLLNAQDGMRAACTEIRLYKLKLVESTAAAVPRSGNTRSYGHWYEEGDRWAMSYGARKRGNRTDLGGYLEAAERWARTLVHLGADTMAVDVNTYALVLYPSRSHSIDVTSAYRSDLVQMLLLVAEKYGLKVILGLNPRATELTWPEVGSNSEGDRLLVDRDGYTHDTVPIGRGNGARTQQPWFHPVHPANEQWLRGLLTEVADRYADYPAFSGIALRVTGYENKSLHNFHSLRWGYGDYTMKRLFADTGIDLRNLSPAERYKRLTDKALKQRWLDWRSRKITGIFASLEQGLHAVAPQLQLYVYAFGGRFFAKDFREAGLDIPMLTDATNVRIVNAQYQYGRVSRGSPPEKALRQDRKWRETLVDTKRLRQFESARHNTAFLFPARYIDDGGLSVQPSALGISRDRLRFKTSAHLMPAGRNYLERFALAMAEGDANLLLQGGNSYFIDQPVIREFLDVYRQIPNRKFTPRADARDPVAVWELQQADGLYFYLVNQLPWKVQASLDLSRPAKLTLLGSGSMGARELEHMELELEGYQLLAGIIEPGVDIDDIQISVSPKVLDRLRSEISSLRQSLSEHRVRNRSVPEHKPNVLRDLIDTAERYLDSGKLWSARNTLQDHRLIELSPVAREPVSGN